LTRASPVSAPGSRPGSWLGAQGPGGENRAVGGTVTGAGDGRGCGTGGTGVIEDALQALEQLGYGRSEAYAVVARVAGELGEGARRSKQLLTQSLKALGR
jgi:hypothetical protein